MAISLQAGPGNNSGSILADGQTVLTFNTTTGVSGVLAPNTVSTASIQNNSITPEKLSQTPGVGLSSEGLPVINTNSYVGGFKNLIINGDMRINQRIGTINVPLTAFAGPIDALGITTSGSVYVVDRFRLATSQYVSSLSWGSVVPSGTVTSTGVIETSQKFDEQKDFFYTEFKLLSTETASNSMYYIDTQLEAYGSALTKFGSQDSKPITLSFFVKSSLPGTHSGGLRYFNALPTASYWTYAYTYTINQPNVWEYKKITIPANTNTNYSFQTGLQSGRPVGLFLASGGDDNHVLTSPVDEANVWNGGFSGTTNRHGHLVGTIDLFKSPVGSTLCFAEIQLEIGDKATAFEQRPYGVELALCQRYYEKSYLPTTPVGTPKGPELAGSGPTVGTTTGYTSKIITNGNGFGLDTDFLVAKRTVPTVRVWSFYDGQLGTASVQLSNIDVIARNISHRGFDIVNQHGTGIGDGLAVAYHWEANAEL